MDDGRRWVDVEKMIEIKISYDTDRERALQDCGIWSALALSGGEPTLNPRLPDYLRYARELGIDATRRIGVLSKGELRRIQLANV